MEPTSEQQAAVDAFATGEDVVITAGAGTGKTATLRLLAQSCPQRRGMYLAFNKAIATEASRSFPSSVQARTAHSVAWRWATGRHAGVLNRLGALRCHPDEQIEALGLQALRLPTAAGQTTFSAHSVLRWVQAMVTDFMHSADESIDPAKHQPVIPGATEKVREMIASELTAAANQLWEDTISPTGFMPVAHDVYLKLWSLSDPELPGDYVLFDEAQDASPVIASVVIKQSKQRVLVGDPAQSIYGFTGAVDAMSSFSSPHQLCLTRSWRFGQSIADAANSYLNALGHPHRLTGNPGVSSHLADSVHAPQAVLARGNATTIAEALKAQKQGMTVHILGGTTNARRFVEAAGQLMSTGRCTHPELAFFTSWDSARDYTTDPTSSTELRTLVRLVDLYGTLTLERVLSSCADREDRAQLLVSTVHKAKGREWDRVDLSDDLDPSYVFEALKKKPRPALLAAAHEELRVGYVATTRARAQLGAGAIAQPLAPFGFPEISTSADADCATHTSRLIAGSGDWKLIEVPVSADLWRDVVDKNGGEEAAFDYLTATVNAVLPELIGVPLDHGESVHPA